MSKASDPPSERTTTDASDNDRLTDALDSLENLLESGDDPGSPLPSEDLSRLEGPLDIHRPSTPQAPAGSAIDTDGRLTGDSAGVVDSAEAQAKQRFLDAQYSIPLPDDGVGYGEAAGEGPPESDGYGPPGLPHSSTVPLEPENGDLDIDDAAPPQPDPLATHLAARLASEVEVIVNSRAQQAMGAVIDDIKREVRKHIEIVLPEILDELAHHSNDEK